MNKEGLFKTNIQWPKYSTVVCKIKQAIKKASSKNYNALQEWKSQNPDFIENDAKQDYFAKIIKECGCELDTINDKDIKKICNSAILTSNNNLDENIID